MLTSAYLGVKGALYTIVMLGQLPYFQSMGVTGVQYQVCGCRPAAHQLKTCTRAPSQSIFLRC